MIKALYNSNKITAKQFAKEYIVEELVMAVTYWDERAESSAETMTEKEKEEVSKFLDQLRERIRKNLKA